ncbi:archease [Saccharomonospora iraqiensis]|uniref:archease n=1 Tax=Saccharomonospora iraqiensis TaxID=52698 RepID=UPI00047E1BC6|nr:archease [Saccharomonospora iraqiensis]
MSGPGEEAAPRGHRTVPHPADLRIEAWAPTRAECLAEAVSALVDSFADVTEVGDHADTGAGWEVTSELTAASDADLLAAVLDEVIYRLDVADLVPTAAGIAEEHADRVRLRLRGVGTDAVEFTGAIPKAVALSDLVLTRTGDGWTAAATVDV